MTYPVNYGLNYGSPSGMSAPAFAFPGMAMGGPTQAAPSQFLPGMEPGGEYAAGAGSGGFKFGLNAPTAQMGLQGLNTLGSLWGAFQAQKLAREQFDFTKSTTNTNLNNSIKSYNTSLEDRARSRGFTEGQSGGQIQSYIDSNRLSR